MLESLWDTIRPMLSREDVKVAREAFDAAEITLGARITSLTATASNAALRRLHAEALAAAKAMTGKVNGS